MLLFIQVFVHVMLRLPSIHRKVETEMANTQTIIEDKLIPSGPAVIRHLVLPPSGHDLEWILSEMNAMDTENDHSADWRSGKLSGAVYHGGEDLQASHTHHILHSNIRLLCHIVCRK